MKLYVLILFRAHLVFHELKCLMCEKVIQLAFDACQFVCLSFNKEQIIPKLMVLAVGM